MMVFFRPGLLIFLVIGLVSGCESNPQGGDDDGDYSATAQDAEDTVVATGRAALAAFQASFGDAPASTALKAIRLRSVITADSITICDPADFPVPTGSSSVRIEGSEGGACNTAFSGDVSAGIARANCSSYDDGDEGARASLLGLVGVEGDPTTVRISSDSLTITLVGETECTAVLNFSLTENGSGELAADGCVRVCGESYQLSGTEAF